MPAIVKIDQTSASCYFKRKTSLFIVVSISGVLLFFLLLGMTLCNVLTVGTKWMFLELYYNHKRVSLEELYEKAMSKSRGKRSSA